MHISKRKHETIVSNPIQQQQMVPTTTNNSENTLNDFGGEKENVDIHNEPLYCRCNNISYGNMVECDNKSVRFIF